jgi:DNA modification methylase
MQTAQRRSSSMPRHWPRAQPDPSTPDGGEAAVWVRLDELKPWAKNPRKNDKAVDPVVDSIRAFGFGAPILARKANSEIIAGHTRFRAAQKLGLERVPVRFLDLDEERAHLLALADNRIGEVAVWEDAALGAVLAELKESGVELDVTGFAEHEVEKLLRLVGAQPTGDESEALETAPEKLQAKWATALGQTWLIPSQTVRGGGHRLRCGSSIETADVAALMDGELAMMMWTDPPYGVSYVGRTADALEIENDKQSPEVLRRFLVECFRAAPLNPGAGWYVCHPAGGISLQFRLAVDEVGWVYRQGLVWVKDSMVLGRSDYHYKHEPIIFGYTNGAKGRRGRGGDGWNGGSAETSVFDVARPKVSELHPTMKPVELVARMVRNSSRPGGIVYEPFSGSGSTMIACEQSRRLCRAMELDPKYVAVALERMAEIGCHGQLCKT